MDTKICNNSISNNFLTNKVLTSIRFSEYAFSFKLIQGVTTCDSIIVECAEEKIQTNKSPKSEKIQRMPVLRKIQGNTARTMPALQFTAENLRRYPEL